MAISETDLDSLGLVSLSYGNQGINPDLVVESACITNNGTVDCTGETVQARVSSCYSYFHECRLPVRGVRVNHKRRRTRRI